MDSSFNHRHALAVVGDGLGDGEPHAHDDRGNGDKYSQRRWARISKPIDKMVHETILPVKALIPADLTESGFY